MENSQSLIEYAKAQGAVSLDKVRGPNGAFISLVDADGGKTTLPIGKKSQDGSLADYKILITDDGQAIATVNSYSNVETMELSVPFEA